MELDVEWSEGAPKLEGLYLVAIELGPTTGYYTFCYWTGEKWDQTYPENVIAFCASHEFLASLRLKWPKPVPEGVDDFQYVPNPNAEDDWREEKTD